MAIQATAGTRAPRGTKILAQAFFEAADGIPEPQRDAVVKAALAAIRDQLKDAREKAKVTKAKAKVKAGKAAPCRWSFEGCRSGRKEAARSGPQEQDGKGQGGGQAVRKAGAQGISQAGTRSDIRDDR